jgi:hypothetical protein
MLLISRIEGTPAVETATGPGEMGAPFQVDENGSFHLTEIRRAKGEGVYPVRVYDEDGNMIAATIIVTKAS